MPRLEIGCSNTQSFFRCVLAYAGMGTLFFDADGDRDLDLYLANYGDDVLYRNDGAGVSSNTGVWFADITAAAGAGAPAAAKAVAAAGTCVPAATAGDLSLAGQKTAGRRPPDASATAGACAPAAAEAAAAAGTCVPAAAAMDLSLAW